MHARPLAYARSWGARPRTGCAGLAARCLTPSRCRMHDNMSTMVCAKEDRLEKLTQDEIISKTKQVIQGLEALKNEHNSILQSLLETLKCLKKDEESNLVEEKSSMIRKSLEMLELGLSEAQVRGRGRGSRAPQGGGSRDRAQPAAGGLSWAVPPGLRRGTSHSHVTLC